MPDNGTLLRGAYEALLTQALSDRIDSDAGHAQLDKLDPTEVADRLAAYLSDIVRDALAALPSKERAAKQVALSNALIGWLAERWSHELQGQDVIEPPQVLRLLTGRLLPGQKPPLLPDIPLLDHDLLTNAPGEPSLAHALTGEMDTADRVDGVIAFIRWTGLRYLFPKLETLRRQGRTIRILTTTFTGSTERKALDWLVEQGIDVKVSYETRTNRLHAKSWLFHRDTGYSTAYVGSSNLSYSALVDGIEWNVRLAEKSAPAVFEKVRATFESLWNDDSFEPYDPQRDGERFERAVSASRAGTATTGVSGLDVKPWPYQREILEALLVHRQRHGRHKTLVVAPTGTGKTVVSALDYRALREGKGGIDVSPDATLLFVAHREQLLDQSLQTFRQVLKRGDFGEKLVGGQRPREWRHVFASVQSLHAMGPSQLDPERFEIIYVDEFHHAEARTYQVLLDHLKPKALIGMTATPERTDGLNVRDRYFDGRYAFEMRLWDALNQQLLAPFHYFGVADGTDLSQLKWERGGYVIRDLEAAYVVRDGNDARTGKIIQSLHDHVADVSEMRAIGFCVSVAHAHYMAQCFNEAGIAAAAIDGSVDIKVRHSILDQLRRRELNVVFAVDVLTEGVDVPEVDTILLLRPTESATVFLQQLGRGLRLHEGKDVCTVLDFIGQQHRRFRSDLRLRAISGRSRGELAKDAEQGFPYLPTGCQIRLDREAEKHIIDNIRAVTSANVNALVRELRVLQDGRSRLTLSQYLEETLYERDDIYRGKLCWTALRRKAQLESRPSGPREEEIGKAIRLRLQQIDDRERLDMLRLLARGEPVPSDARSQALAAMLGFILFDDGNAPMSVELVQQGLNDEPAIREEILELADLLDERAEVVTRPSNLWPDVPLHVHATYRREEVLVALGSRQLGAKVAMREGVKYVKSRNVDLLFVTLTKSERLYSPSTRYRDYAISRDLFHWESQSGTRRESPTGRRYLSGSSTVLLFVRKQPKLNRERASGFVFLGPVNRVEDRGEKPIRITWRLVTPMSEAIVRESRAVSI